ERRAQDVQFLAVPRPGPGVDGPADPIQGSARTDDLVFPLSEAIEHRRSRGAFSGAGRDGGRRRRGGRRNQLWRLFGAQFVAEEEGFIERLRAIEGATPAALAAEEAHLVPLRDAWAASVAGKSRFRSAARGAYDALGLLLGGL